MIPIKESLNNELGISVNIKDTNIHKSTQAELSYFGAYTKDIFSRVHTYFESAKTCIKERISINSKKFQQFNKKPLILITISLVALQALGFYFLHQEDLKRLKESSLHLYEKNLRDILGENALELDPKDDRPGALILFSSNDHNSAFDPLNSKDQFLPLNKTHDIYFKVISQGSEVCSKIKEAANIKPIKTLIIGAHGEHDSNSLYLSPSTFSYSPNKNAKSFLDSLEWNQKCFEKLDESAEITLIACSSGGKNDGVAATLANVANRVVWSPYDFSATPLITFNEEIPARPVFNSFSAAKNGNPFWYYLGPGDTCQSLPSGGHSCGFLNNLKLKYREYFPSKPVVSESRSPFHL